MIPVHRLDNALLLPIPWQLSICSASIQFKNGSVYEQLCRSRGTRREQDAPTRWPPWSCHNWRIHESLRPILMVCFLRLDGREPVFCSKRFLNHPNPAYAEVRYEWSRWRSMANSRYILCQKISSNFSALLWNSSHSLLLEFESGGLVKMAPCNVHI